MIMITIASIVEEMMADLDGVDLLPQHLLHLHLHLFNENVSVDLMNVRIHQNVILNNHKKRQ